MQKKLEKGVSEGKKTDSAATWKIQEKYDLFFYKRPLYGTSAPS